MKIFLCSLLSIRDISDSSDDSNQSSRFLFATSIIVLTMWFIRVLRLISIFVIAVWAETHISTSLMILMPSIMLVSFRSIYNDVSRCYRRFSLKAYLLKEFISLIWARVVSSNVLWDLTNRFSHNFSIQSLVRAIEFSNVLIAQVSVDCESLSLFVAANTLSASFFRFQILRFMISSLMNQLYMLCCIWADVKLWKSFVRRFCS